MVDEIEFIHVEESGNRDHDTPVIIKFFEVSGKWSICHQKSGQNAFKKEVNMFDTKQDAIEFAEDHDCVVFDT